MKVMIMNNKGFTLIELLAIVVLLSIIAALAVPNITKEINSSDKHKEKVLNEEIEYASKLYVAKYYASTLFTNPNDIKFTLNDLEKDGLIRLNDGVCDGKKNEDIEITSSIEYDFSSIKDANCFVCDGNCKIK